MKKQLSLTSFVLLSVALLIGVMLILSTNHAGNSSNGSFANALSNSGASKYDKHGLGSASLDQVRQYTVDYVMQSRDVRSGTPQLLLMRFVTREDIPSLGLGCLGESITIEEPPMALAIFKGDFSGGQVDMEARYVAYVFDLWAGMPLSIITSVNGEGFQKVLKDPSLPDGVWGNSYICPTPRPLIKTLHYGDTVPGFTTPPGLAPDIATSVALQALTPTTLPITPPALPSPIETVVSTRVPLPVATTLSTVVP